MASTITAAARRLPNPATDATLLDRFAADRDEPAFAELVRRHGPLVLGVCRRLARTDAEDAFQAVFLVLARKAGSVSRPEQLANYLYGVAVRVGRRARRSAGRRRERTMPRLPDVPAPVPPNGELTELIDAALCRLPDRLRAAVVLCEIQGLSRTEAAARLGIPEGTLSSRLADARKRLANLLSGQVILAGLTVPVSAALTNRAVATATGELVSGAVLALATGGTTMRTVTLAITTLTLAGLTAMAGAIPTATRDDPPKPAVKADAPKEAVKEPAPAYTAKPKLGKFLDLPGSVDRIEWTGDGKKLVVVKRVAVVENDPNNAVNPAAPRRRTYRDSVVVVDPIQGAVLTESAFKTTERYLAISPDCERVLVVRRDAAKISGVHRVEVRKLTRRPEPANLEAVGGPERIAQDAQPERVIDLDSDETVAGRYSGNGAKILLVRSRLMNGQHTDVRLWEYDLAYADPAGKELLKLDAKYLQLALSPAAAELITLAGDGKIGWHSADPKRPAVVIDAIPTIRNRFGNEGWVRDGSNSSWSFSTAFSPAGDAVVVTASPNNPPYTLNFIVRRSTPVVATFGEQAVLGGGTFSANGQLFCGVAYPANQNRQGSNDGTLTVWDAKTLSTVKWWNGHAVPAFAPNKLVLAIAEPLDRSMTRVGFWDFSPPPGK